jgi:hypothetical protein
VWSLIVFFFWLFVGYCACVFWRLPRWHSQGAIPRPHYGTLHRPHLGPSLRSRDRREGRGSERAE